MSDKIKDLRLFQDDLIKFYEDLRGNIQLSHDIRMSANKVLGGLYSLQQDLIKLEIEELKK